MTPQLTVKLTPEAQETLRAVQTLPQNVLLGIAAAMDLQNQYTISHVVRDYLSFPKSGPSKDIGLRVQTGRGRASVRASKAKVNGQEVQSAIGSNVEYMFYHEFGAHHPARNANVHFGKADKFGRRKFSTASQADIGMRVHHGEWDAPARGMVQHGIEDRLDDYSAAISAEIQEVWDEGKS